MYTTIKAEAAVRSRKISDLWASKAMLHRTLVAVGVQVFCQFTGINGMYWFHFFQSRWLTRGPVINYFGPQMYASLGITGSKALLVQGFANCYFRYSVCSSWSQHLRGSRTNCQLHVSTYTSLHPWANLKTLQFHHALPWSCWPEETPFVWCHRFRCIICYTCCYRCDEPTPTGRSPRNC